MYADSLQIPLEDIRASQYKPLNILQWTSSARIALPINEALLDPAKTIWRTTATILHTCKSANKKYYVLAKDSEFLFSYPAPNFLVVKAVNEYGRQNHIKSTPDKKQKCLDLLAVRNTHLQHFSLGSQITMLLRQNITMHVILSLSPLLSAC